MKKAVFFFCATAVCWALAGFLTVRFVKTIAEEANASLATIEAPGSVIFPIEEAGQISLWHNYQDFREGRTVREDPELPGGFSFELKEMTSGALMPFTPSIANTNMSSGRLSKKGVGTFAVANAGDYELTVTAPAGQSRVISLSEGTMMESFKSIFGLVGSATLFGVVGLVFLILGIVFLFVKPKPKPPLPDHAS